MFKHNETAKNTFFDFLTQRSFFACSVKFTRPNILIDHSQIIKLKISVKNIMYH